MGTVNCIEAVLPGMLERRAGRIAVVASVTGFAALPRAAAYGATKAFLITMCDSLRADLAGTGVEVTAVNPGFVTTPLTAQNEFEMPFLIEAHEAARTIADGLEAGQAGDLVPAPDGADDEDARRGARRRSRAATRRGSRSGCARRMILYRTFGNGLLRPLLHRSTGSRSRAGSGSRRAGPPCSPPATTR